MRSRVGIRNLLDLHGTQAALEDSGLLKIPTLPFSVGIFMAMRTPSHLVSGRYVIM
jgi:hypothetical protein